MSMIGNYRRIPQTTLNELLAHPDQLSSFLYPEDGSDEAPHLDLDKSWHLIHFLLNGDTWEGAWPLVGAVMGGTEISDEDVGYGPARYLTPDEVAEVAAALSRVPPDVLWSRFDTDAVRRAEIYPEGWSGGQDDETYVLDYYKQLQAFFATAAREHQVVVLYLN